MDYTDAVAALTRAVDEGVQFEFPVAWGMDLQSEHERYLTEQLVGRPVVVMNYPKDIKAFYMRVNDDGRTVAAMDVLAPGIGEIIGGSQREERLDVLDAPHRRDGPRPGGVLVVPRPAPLRHRPPRRLRPRLRADDGLHHRHGQRPRRDPVPPDPEERRLLTAHDGGAGGVLAGTETRRDRGAGDARSAGLPSRTPFRSPTAPRFGRVRAGSGRQGRTRTPQLAHRARSRSPSASISPRSGHCRAHGRTNRQIPPRARFRSPESLRFPHETPRTTTLRVHETGLPPLGLHSDQRYAGWEHATDWIVGGRRGGGLGVPVRRPERLLGGRWDRRRRSPLTGDPRQRAGPGTRLRGRALGDSNLKVLAGLLALALARRWGRSLSRRALLVAGWGVGLLLTLYGGLGLANAALTELGVVESTDPVTTTRWYLFLWEPIWLVGGILFIVAVRRYGRDTTSGPGGAVRGDRPGR